MLMATCCADSWNLAPPLPETRPAGWLGLPQASWPARIWSETRQCVTKPRHTDRRNDLRWRLFVPGALRIRLELKSKQVRSRGATKNDQTNLWSMSDARSAHHTSDRTHGLATCVQTWLRTIDAARIIDCHVYDLVTSWRWLQVIVFVC